MPRSPMPRRRRETKGHRPAFTPPCTTIFENVERPRALWLPEAVRISKSRSLRDELSSLLRPSAERRRVSAFCDRRFCRSVVPYRSAHRSTETLPNRQRLRPLRPQQHNAAARTGFAIASRDRIAGIVLHAGKVPRAHERGIGLADVDVVEPDLHHAGAR